MNIPVQPQPVSLTRIQIWQGIFGRLIEIAAAETSLQEREALYVFLGSKRDVLLPVDDAS